MSSEEKPKCPVCGSGNVSEVRPVSEEQKQKLQCSVCSQTWEADRKKQ